MRRRERERFRGVWGRPEIAAGGFDVLCFFVIVVGAAAAIAVGVLPTPELAERLVDVSDVTAVIVVVLCG